MKKRFDRANALLRAEMRNINQRFDQGAEQEKLAQGVAPYIPCHSGCANCCDMLVIATAPDAAYVIAQKPDIVERVRDKLLEQEQILKDLGINFVDFTDEKQQGDFTYAWWEKRIPCAFLSDQKECMIYDERPLTCREYYAYDRHPDTCAERAGPSVIYTSWDPMISARRAFFDRAKLSEKLYGKLILGSFVTLVLHALSRK